LGASYYFYMSWRPDFLILIVISTLIDYTAGRLMGRTPEKAKRKKYLALSLASNLGLLLTFKYFNFILSSISATLDFLQVDQNIPELNLLLPVGISFYTFQTLSYSIDVYRGKKEPEKHLGIFALYVSFFPQLVAGPIERSIHLLPQFHQKHPFDSMRITSGFQQILWGFLKKVVIADNLAALVNTVYNSPTEFNSTELLIGTYLFSFQIFCDFSGYSDIAIGVAKILGYDLMENFRRPYFSKSIAEFWRRWHISLSTWFRDYLYIPLGGNHVPAPQWYFNLFVVFLISGLWHGANWTFVIWGALHGLYFILSIELTPLREAIVKFMQLERFPWLYKFIQVFTTYHLVTFAWIFFRANSLSDAFYIVSNIFNFSSLELPYFKHELLIPLMLILLMEFIHLLQRNGSIRERINQQPTWIRWGIYYATIIFILLFGVFENQQFIYFQF
jgi:alginate O-acetyltransferase complex protein AlgI